MVELDDVTLGYKGRGELIAHACARFEASQLTALVGRNGTGKSTLLRAMAGLNDAYGGRIMVDGKPLGELSPRERARLIAFVNTRRVSVAKMTCSAVVATGRAPYTDWMGRLSAADSRIVDDSLAMVGMDDFANREIDTLSDGECQRVMIARALAQSTPVVLLDEPTSFLDIPNRIELCELLCSLTRDHGKCIVFSTHELELALSFADRVALVAECSLTVDAPAAMAERLADWRIRK